MSWFSRKPVVVLALLALVAIGGVKLLLWNQVKRSADDFVRHMSLHAAVHYEGIETSLMGSVGIRGITIRPHGVSDSVRIERIRFSAAHLPALLRLRSDLESFRIPSEMTLEVQGLTLDAHGELLYSLIDDAADNALETAFFGCGDFGAVTAASYPDMGYDRLISNIRLSQVYNKRDDSLLLKADLHTEEMVDIGIAVRLTSIPGGQLTPMAFMQQMPEVSRITLRYQDYAYNERRNRYCAERGGVDVAEFLDSHQAAVRAALAAQNIHPSEGLQIAYRRFVEGAGHIELSMRPERNVSFLELALYQPHDLVRRLGTQLEVNGARVYDLSLRRQGSEEGAVAAPASPAGSAAATTRRVATPALPQFRPVAVSELDRHVGRPARVVLTSGLQRSGVIEQIDAQHLMLRRRLHGGVVDYPIAFSDIERVDVEL
ncbi:hypothetical protein CAI21_10240 [Alkalilimnicola ehrlichii]|uniref:Uncharacterized protein n=1 Tax=Alkalilimnicola ehrlichii TaxID=351052 RepID=A0A3E0WV51_9GAMM|nr:hypothetical protein [Alkalilimnicola ehrlichii]RFA29142.1 hypothetical protein CAI21_10240 [Alkalilimnicola ehrlichii]RFA36053.1 hypothetical protein CAL65_11385 [Alkalilimnicola ehrlichii]